MQDAYQNLVNKLEALGQLEQIMGIMHWDQEVIMPAGGAQARGGQLASLAGVIHEKITDPSIGELLDQLESGASNDFDPYQQCNIRETRRVYDRETKVPMELVQELAELGSRGHHVWARAREENKYSDFAPVLERLIELKKQWTDPSFFRGRGTRLPRLLRVKAWGQVLSFLANLGSASRRR